LNLPVWRAIALLAAGVVVALGLWACVVPAGLSDHEFMKALRTPLRDMTVGHAAWLIFFAWLLFKWRRTAV
jgi:hypothetical protein